MDVKFPQADFVKDAFVLQDLKITATYWHEFNYLHLSYIYFNCTYIKMLELEFELRTIK